MDQNDNAAGEIHLNNLQIAEQAQPTYHDYRAPDGQGFFFREEPLEPVEDSVFLLFDINRTQMLDVLRPLLQEQHTRNRLAGEVREVVTNHLFQNLIGDPPQLYTQEVQALYGQHIVTPEFNLEGQLATLAQDHAAHARKISTDATLVEQADEWLKHLNAGRYREAASNLSQVLLDIEQGNEIYTDYFKREAVCQTYLEDYLAHGAWPGEACILLYAEAVGRNIQLWRYNEKGALQTGRHYRNADRDPNILHILQTNIHYACHRLVVAERPEHYRAVITNDPFRGPGTNAANQPVSMPYTIGDGERFIFDCVRYGCEDLLRVIANRDQTMDELVGQLRKHYLKTLPNTQQELDKLIVKFDVKAIFAEMEVTFNQLAEASIDLLMQDKQRPAGVYSREAHARKLEGVVEQMRALRISAQNALEARIAEGGENELRTVYNPNYHFPDTVERMSLAEANAFYREHLLGRVNILVEQFQQHYDFDNTEKQLLEAKRAYVSSGKNEYRRCQIYTQLTTEHREAAAEVFMARNVRPAMRTDAAMRSNVPLQFLATAENVRISLLTEAMGLLTACDRAGDILAHIAARYGHFQLYFFLKKHSMVNFNQANNARELAIHMRHPSTGNTMLHCAVMACKLGAANTLEGWTMVKKLIEEQRMRECIRTSYQGKESAFIEGGAQLGSDAIDRIQNIALQGPLDIPVEFEAKDGEIAAKPLLHIFYERKDLKTFQWLLNAGADPLLEGDAHIGKDQVQTNGTILELASKENKAGRPYFSAILEHIEKREVHGAWLGNMLQEIDKQIPLPQALSGAEEQSYLTEFATNFQKKVLGYAKEAALAKRVCSGVFERLFDKKDVREHRLKTFVTLVKALRRAAIEGNPDHIQVAAQSAAVGGPTGPRGRSGLRDSMKDFSENNALDPETRNEARRLRQDIIAARGRSPISPSVLFAQAPAEMSEEARGKFEAQSNKTDDLTQRVDANAEEQRQANEAQRQANDAQRQANDAQQKAIEEQGSKITGLQAEMSDIKNLLQLLIQAQHNHDNRDSDPGPASPPPFGRRRGRTFSPPLATDSSGASADEAQKGKARKKSLKKK